MFFCRHHLRPALLSAAFLLCACLPEPASAERLRLNSGSIKNWELANGELVQAAIIHYSLHTRIITLELVNGTRVHVAPRDLAGASKFDWLTSDAFIQSLSGYRVPSDAGLPLARTFLILSVGTMLGLFLAFWVAVSMMTGKGSIRRAGVAFVRLAGFALLAGAAGAVVAFGLGRMLDQVAYFSLIISVVYLLTIFLILAMTCRIIGRSYGASEWTGIRTLFVTGVLFAVGSFGLMVGMPRAMNQPGIDEWLTEQVLTPLDLA